MAWSQAHTALANTISKQNGMPFFMVEAWMHANEGQVNQMLAANPQAGQQGQQAMDKAHWMNQNPEQAQKEIYQNSDAGKEQARAEGESRDITQKMQDFYKLMSQPVINADGTTQDPIMHQLLNAGNRAGMQNGAGRGLGSNVSNLNTQAAMMQSATPYLQDRQHMAQQALGELSNRDNSLDQRRQAWTNMQNQQAQQTWAANKNQNAGIGAGIGTVAGGIASTALGLGPAPGMQVGGAMGGGIGSLAGPAAPAYNPYYKPSGGGY